MISVNKYIKEQDEEEYEDEGPEGEEIEVESCPNLESCPIFEEMGDEDKEYILSNYCQGDYDLCARYQLSQLGVDVPYDLHPEDEERAKELAGE